MDGGPPGSARITTAWAVLLLALAGFLSFRGSLDVPFLFDDEPAIVDNPRIEHLWPFGSHGYAVQSTEAGRPVVRLSLALNHALGELEVSGAGPLARALRALGVGAGGRDPRGYHVANLALHVFSALVLFLLARRTLARPACPPSVRAAPEALAFLVSLLWLVHPLQVDAVTYVIQRTELLMGLFALLSLHLALAAHEARRPRRWEAASVLACALGMGSKEAMAAVPILVALQDRAWVYPDWRAAWRARRGLYVGLAATWGLLACIVAAGPRDQTVGFDLGVAWWRYAATQLVMVAHYLRLAFWPVGLCFDYGRRLTDSPGAVALGALVVLPLLGGTLWALLRRPGLGFAGAWFFGFLAPSSSVIPIASEVGAERRMHLPLVPVVALAVLGLQAATVSLGRRAPAPGALWARAVLPAAGILLAALLGTATARRNAVFASDLSIWLDTVARRPDNAGAHNNLGRVYAKRGRFAEALEHFRIAASMPEADEATQDNLGKALVDLGRSEEAVEHYRGLLRAQPSFWKGRVGLARAYMDLGRWAEAVDEYRRCLAGGHESADLQNDLGRALFRAGRRAEAVQALERAREIDPEHGLARQNLATLRGQPDRP
jgi:Flp pilus assembly protein TadD